MSLLVWSSLITIFSKRSCSMSPAQQKKLQELSLIFSEGKASPKQIKELSELLAQINKVHSEVLFKPEKAVSYMNK